jgi:hypothetical protein
MGEELFASYGYIYWVKALQPSNDSRESLVDDEDFETKLAVLENHAVNEIVDIMEVPNAKYEDL